MFAITGDITAWSRRIALLPYHPAVPLSVSYTVVR
jgi:hypothetical protein